jgi:hypothetical protein
MITFKLSVATFRVACFQAESHCSVSIVSGCRLFLFDILHEHSILHLETRLVKHLVLEFHVFASHTS